MNRDEYLKMAALEDSMWHYRSLHRHVRRELLHGVFLVFSGTQLVILGLLGEYLGRLIQTINQFPPSAMQPDQ